MEKIASGLLARILVSSAAKSVSARSKYSVATISAPRALSDSPYDCAADRPQSSLVTMNAMRLPRAIFDSVSPIDFPFSVVVVARKK